MLVDQLLYDIQTTNSIQNVSHNHTYNIRIANYEYKIYVLFKQRKYWLPYLCLCLL